MNNTYNFPVELQPVFLSNGNQIAKKRAVVRTDTMDTLGIVSEDYGLVEHGKVIDSLREAGHEYGVAEKISVTNNGANLFYQMIFPKVEMEVKKGDIIKMMMIARNSYNAMKSLSIIFGAFRLVCENGMVIGTQFIQFAYRHIGNVGGMNDSFMIDEYKDTYKAYIKLFGERMPQITQMARLPLQSNEGLFDKKQVQLPEYLIQEAKTSFETEHDHTVWGYYNSLTHAITHKMRKDSPENKIRYGVEAWKVAERLMN